MAIVDMDMENVLTSIADTFRPYFKHIEYRDYKTHVEEGIAVRFQMQLNYYEDEFSLSRYQDFVVIFTSNTSVFVASPEDTFTWWKNPEIFKNTSNHDSCWRSDGLRFLFDTYMKMADSINTELLDEGFEQVPPADMSQHNRFNFGKMVERVRIEKEKLDDSYHYKLTKIEKLPLFGEE